MAECSKEKLRSNIWKFYLFDIFAGMLFAIPVIVLFWQENGLSLTQIMILQSFFSLLLVVLEIPTGYLADIYGRKNILILSGASIFVGTLAYSLTYSFSGFLLAEMFFAIGLSLYSGTSSAFIYDTLKELGKEKDYRLVWGNAKYYTFLAMAVSNVIGGIIGKINLRWAFYFSLPFLFVAVLVSLSYNEPRRHKMTVKESHLKNLKNIIKDAFANIKLRWIIVYTGLIFGFNSAGLWLYQPYFKLTGIDIVFFGVIFASFQIVAAISSKYAHRIEDKLGLKKSLVILVFIIALAYVLLSKIVFMFSFVFIYLFQFVRGFSEPVFSDYINKMASAKTRATILSVKGLFDRLTYALMIPFVGWIADVYSILQAFMVTGVTCLIIGCIVLMILRKDKVI